MGETAEVAESRGARRLGLNAATIRHLRSLLAERDALARLVARLSAALAVETAA